MRSSTCCPSHCASRCSTTASSAGIAPSGRSRQAPGTRIPLLIAVGFALVIIPVSAGMFARQLRLVGTSPVQRLAAFVDPFRSINDYGLFAVMTQTRPEIVVEGSADGVTWRTYEFRDKPGALTQRPGWVAPFQPRLDWQMWFAALDEFDENPWIERFCRRVLEGSPAVLDLLAVNPFPNAPPQFVRLRRSRYHVASVDAHRREGVWWTRDGWHPYSPVLSRR